MQVLDVVVSICAAAAGAGIAVLLRSNIGVHRPPVGQRRRTNTIWTAVTLLASALLAVLIALSS